MISKFAFLAEHQRNLRLQTLSSAPHVTVSPLIISVLKGEICPTYSNFTSRQTFVLNILVCTRQRVCFLVQKNMGSAVRISFSYVLKLQYFKISQSHSSIIMGDHLNVIDFFLLLKY